MPGIVSLGLNVSRSLCTSSFVRQIRAWFSVAQLSGSNPHAWREQISNHSCDLIGELPLTLAPDFRAFLALPSARRASSDSHRAKPCGTLLLPVIFEEVQDVLPPTVPNMNTLKTTQATIFAKSPDDLGGKNGACETGAQAP